MNTTTTMKVAAEVRDRLAVLARRHHRTLGAELSALVSEAEEREWWRAAEAAVRRLQADPARWGDYLAETDEWDVVAADATADAVGDWPEFNRGKRS